MGEGAANLPDPSWYTLPYAALPLAACLAILAARRLGQVQLLLVAMARLIVQILILGLILGWLFRARNPWLVGLVVLVMLLASAQTVSVRHRRGDWALRAEAFISMCFALAVVILVTTRLALRVDPWYDPRVLIPLVGMVLGNSVNGVTLAAERLQSDLRAERDLVELRLSLGATARAAALPVLRAAIRAGLTPTINKMMITGVVAIPGMTTGQLLAGANVASALRYQVLVYLGITSMVGLSTLALIWFRMRRYFTPAHQLRIEMIAERAE